MARQVETGQQRSAYAAAGVDVAAGERAVERLRARLAAGGSDLLGIGGFGAAVELPPGYSRPVLVTATDGVGTKTEIARAMGRLETIGRDVVAMCADDVVCHGARPTYFLDYLALGRLEAERVAALVGGIADACESIGCRLVGGETAEHPGVMDVDAFDVAGFCIGFVEREQLIDGSTARAGDVLLGLASSGLHANGYSLVRALLSRHGLDLEAAWSDVLAAHDLAADGIPAGHRLGDELLRPTRLYSSAVLRLRDDLQARSLRLAALLHVTGGGLPGNLTRGLPPGLGAAVQLGSWPEPVVFRLLAALGRLDGPEMRATFNCGLGMVAIVESEAVEPAIGLLAGEGIESWPIGELRPTNELAGARYAEFG